MADRTPSYLRLLGTLDRRFVASALADTGDSGASYTQAGPFPGVAVADQRGLGRIDASGEMAAGADLDVRSVSGGGAGAARVAWRHPGDALWRGWDPPIAISQFAFIDRSTTANAWKDPHVAARSDGYAWIAVQADERYIKVFRRARGGTSWTAATVYDSGGTGYSSDNAAPCIVVLPSGRLLCLFWREIYGLSMGSLASAYSDDDGATWTDVQAHSLSGITLAPTRLRAAYANGQVLMVCSYGGGPSDTWIQLASADLGNTFEIVGSDSGLCRIEVIGGDDGFLVAGIQNAPPPSGALVAPWVYAIGSAYTSIEDAVGVLATPAASTVEWGTVGAGPGYVLSDGDLAMCRDEFGAIWLYGRNAADTQNGVATYSADGGSTWTSLGGWWRGNDASTYPTAITVAGQGGRVIMAGANSANPGTGDPSLCVYGLGGSTTVWLGEYAELGIDYAAWWSTTWLPFDLPENTGAAWTAATTATAPTVTITGLGMRVQHSDAGSSATWTAVPGNTNSDGILATTEMRITAGTGALVLRIGDAGPSSYSVRVAVSTTAITLRDQTAATTIATVTTAAGTTGVEVMVALGDTAGGAASGQCYAWYRESGADADREWILIGSSTALTQGAVTTDSVVFGTIGGNAATDVYFRAVNYSDAQGLYGGQSNPGGLLGQVVGSTPGPVAETGTRVAYRGGPTVIGESWSVPVAYEYPLSRVDPVTSPSPRTPWRSLTDGVDADIVYDLTDAQSVTSPLYAVYLDGANFGTATWSGWDGAAWVLLGTVDLQVGSSLKYTRSGNTIRCDPSGGSACADHIAREALRGGTWKTGVGGILRRIAHNTAGRWDATATAGLIQRPIITLEDYDAGDAASGSSGAIYSPRGALVLRGQSTGYSRYRLQISSQDTAEGYYTLGALAVMPLTVLGDHDYRSIGIATNVDTVTARSGSRRKTRLGEPARYAIVGWTDGVDGSNVHDTSPDYVRAYTGGEVAGTPAAVAGDVIGLLAENDTVPVLYLPRVPVPASVGATMITSPDILLYADISSDTIQSDVVVGDEHTGSGAGELVRVGVVRLDEAL